MLRYVDGGVNKYEAVFRFESGSGDNEVKRFYAGFDEVYATPKAVMEGVVETLRWYSGDVQVGNDFRW